MIANLPPSWAVPRLGDICEINPRSKPDPALDDKVSFVSMSAVNERFGRIVAASARNYREVMKGYTPFIDGDVLFAKITPCMENGKAAIARGLVNGVGYGSTEFHVLRPSSLVMAEWVFFLLRVDAVRRQAAASFQGAVGQQRVPESFLASFKIPLPIISEQQKIVSVLNEADMIRGLRVISDKKTSVISSGALNYYFEAHFSNHARVATVRLGDIADVQGGVQVSRKRDAIPRRVPYLRVANVQRDKLALDEILEIGVTEQELTRTALRPGDILVVEGHGNPKELGRAAVWNGEIEQCVHQNHLIRVRCGESIDPYFVSAFLNSVFGRRHFFVSGNTTSGLSTISTRVVSDVRLPLPSKEERAAYSEWVMGFRSLTAVAELGRKLEVNLTGSLQTNAFSGQLTAGWRETQLDDHMDELRARDDALNAIGSTDSRDPADDLPAYENVPRDEGPRFELARDQYRVLGQLERSEWKLADDGAQDRDTSRIFTAAEVAHALTGSLHGNVQAVESNLAVLVARGLVIALSLEQRTPDTDETVYGNCYRLPVADPVADEDDDAQSMAGVEGARDQEILRLLGNRKREETVP